MAAKRADISKKLRFEVFKRDGFRCQYCGAAAPDVLLVLDHVKPIAEGGTNDILNLLTACDPCNNGKGARVLSDQSVLAKQREQLDALSERREQLEMMIAWKDHLANLKEHAVDRIAEHWAKLTRGFTLNDHGRQSLKKLLRKIEAEEILDAMEIAAEQYFEHKDGTLAHPSVETAWSKIGGICYVKRSEADKPYLRDLLYIRGIVRNRMHVNDAEVLAFMEDVYLDGLSLDFLKTCATRCRDWRHFQGVAVAGLQIPSACDELEDEDDESDPTSP